MTSIQLKDDRKSASKDHVIRQKCKRKEIEKTRGQATEIYGLKSVRKINRRNVGHVKDSNQDGKARDSATRDINKNDAVFKEKIFNNVEAATMGSRSSTEQNHNKLKYQDISTATSQRNRIAKNSIPHRIRSA